MPTHALYRQGGLTLPLGGSCRQVGAARADFFRTAFLFYHGGVYADLDVESVAAFDPTLDQVHALPPGRTPCAAKLLTALPCPSVFSVVGVASVAAPLRGAR